VIQRGDRPCLSLEAFAQFGGGSNMRGQYLDRNRAVQAGIPGAKHFPHPVGANRGDYLVRAETRAPGQGH